MQKTYTIEKENINGYLEAKGRWESLSISCESDFEGIFRRTQSIAIEKQEE